ncbi:hypothetical protein EDEG_02389 [Edhazardia aedis USNM 41457]|uniref:Uncharacterized protein n=1 Tax=Edhazardia aedis (strain USNM 41457) TaxID=1003232 RepID=J9D611_EDHAE|nr:hypothetical protein EDEG_02389 [Edhazardia aedis USNM 41457]|eukprot:EJW03221.1 hypothetical protein EDEG_02389 [Edhazardia aedis USNM 41457]
MVIFFSNMLSVLTMNSETTNQALIVDHSSQASEPHSETPQNTLTGHLINLTKHECLTHTKNDNINKEGRKINGKTNITENVASDSTNRVRNFQKNIEEPQNGNQRKRLRRSKPLKKKENHLLEIIDTFKILNYYFPNFENQIKTTKKSLFDFFKQQLDSFDNEASIIFDHVKKAFGPSEKTKQCSDEKREVLNNYEEFLKIFVNSDDLKKKNIVVRPIWNVISLFYPEVYGLLRILITKNQYFSVLKSTENIQIEFIKEEQIRDFHRPKNHEMESYLQSIEKEFNSIKDSKILSFSENLESFLTSCKKLIEFQIESIKANEKAKEKARNGHIEDSEIVKIKNLKSIPCLSEIGITKLLQVEKLRKNFKDLKLLRHLKTLDMFISFFNVILSFPGNILDKYQELFYFKICKLQEQLTCFEDQNNKMINFLIIFKYNCTFELSSFAKTRFEYQIDKALYDYYKVNSSNIDNISDRKKQIDKIKDHFYSILLKSGFRSDLNEIFTANIEKLEYLIGEKRLNGEKSTNSFKVYFNNRIDENEAKLYQPESQQEALYSSEMAFFKNLTILNIYLSILKS